MGREAFCKLLFVTDISGVTVQHEQPVTTKFSSGVDHYANLYESSEYDSFDLNARNHNSKRTHIFSKSRNGNLVVCEAHSWSCLLPIDFPWQSKERVQAMVWPSYCVYVQLVIRLSRRLLFHWCKAVNRYSWKSGHIALFHFQCVERIWTRGW